MNIPIRKQTEGFDKGTHLKYQAFLNNLDEAIALFKIITDENSFPLDITCLGVNNAFEKLFRLNKEQIIGKRVMDFFPESKICPGYQRCLFRGANFLVKNVRFEHFFDTLDIWVSIKITGPEKGYFVATFSDITREKKLEEQVRYLSLRDPLTGLFNRTYFLQELSSLKENPPFSVSLFICDIDGLNLINDTKGYQTGDLLLQATAKILKDSFNYKSIVARIGSAEFAVLTPNNNEITLENSVQKIKKQLSMFNLTHPEQHLSISWGYAVRTWPINIHEIIKEARNDMRRVKLYGSKSSRHSYMRALMRTLEARDIVTQSHVERMQRQIWSFAATIGFPENKKIALYLLAQFHDIGKVGIPDSILNKPGPLTLDERKEMQNHCEIGCRIAQAVPELAIISDWVLKHHEWWNGNGYPLGLKGVEIPLECRILAIVDAYDAMTSNRPYRKALSHEEALAELKRWEGTQFDPQLVAKFINSLENINAAAR